MEIRKINFRGKTIKDNRWVYGHYFVTPLTDEDSGADQKTGWFFLTGEKRHCISNENGAVFVVDEKTVSQSTSLKDKNGVEIFEGDIVRAVYQENEGGGWVSESKIMGIVKFDPYWGVKFDCKDGTQRTAQYWGESYKDFRAVEIIGNIYENPELLTSPLQEQ